MKTLRTILVLSACVILRGTLSAQSAPPTITFNVPLQLHELHPDIKTIGVNAHAYDNPGANHACATGNAVLTCPPDGNVNQTVTVVAEQIEGQDITKATSYSVTLQLFSANGSQYDPKQSSDGPIQGRAKEGTAFTDIVRGAVSW
jgi:hypothetical protein